MIDIIKDFFEQNVQKKTFSELSINKEENIPLINSNLLSFDYDSINPEIKTTDTIIFEKGFITFVEFKYGKINEIDFRLKFTESLISFIDYSIDNKLINNITFPNKYFKFYIVYKFKSATFDIEMNRIQRKLKSQYKYFVSNYTIISNDKFKKIYL